MLSSKYKVIIILFNGSLLHVFTLIQIQTKLKLSDTSSKLRMVTMFVTVNLQNTS